MRLTTRNPYFTPDPINPEPLGDPARFRPLKEYAYGTQNDPPNEPGNLVNGKLWSAKRYNYLSLTGVISATETYVYGDPAGRRTGRRTIMLDETVGGGLIQAFDQSVTYDDLGNVVSEEYPTCANCGEARLDRIDRTYTFGLPTAVTSWGAYGTKTIASDMRYHPSGIVASILHGNSVKDTIAPDPYGMARPLSLAYTPFNECDAPTITVQPPSQQVVPEGSQVTLSVSATGTPTLRYQWYRNSIAIIGATGPTYTTPPLSMSTTFNVRVSSTCGRTDSGGTEVNSSGVFSALAAITVLDCGNAPEITAQPQCAAIREGEFATLSVTATGGETFIYEWFEGEPGDTEQSVGSGQSFTTPALNDSRRYWVRVTNECGATTSAPADVNVYQTPTRVQLGARYGASTYVDAIWPAATTNGNLLVAFVATPGGVLTASPSTGWRRIARASSSTAVLEIHIIENAAPHSGVERFRFSKATVAQIWIAEYRGLDAACFDAMVTNAGYAFPPSSGILTPSTNHVLSLTGFGIGSSRTFSNATNGWTEIAERATTKISAAIHERAVTTSGPSSHQVTVSGSATPWIALQAVFKAARIP